ncbi:hypothetical protein LCGC14_2801680 [marine sediment metagenome]|uniref:Zinc finger CHC2-type domain-containing protein n=1 Tax=marine sediment metagenome TaxID=412755 RepID=A0A0F9AVX7_9ZZZZ
MTLTITERAPFSYVDFWTSLHHCLPDGNSACVVLYAFAHVTGEPLTIGTYYNGTPIPWPLCTLCNRCFVEPAIWRLPLAPRLPLVCADCLPDDYMRFCSEEYLRRDWLISVLSGRKHGSYPGDLPPKRKYAGPKSASKFDKIKAAVRLEEFAGRFTDLRSASPNKLKGCCPLHKESTPSFHVWLDKQTWRCFGACAMGGDVIALHQQLKDRGLLIGKT